MAPASWGQAPVHQILVREPDMIRSIAACKAMGAGPLAHADAAIVVAADTQASELWIEDASVVSTYILLGAEELGVGACWIHIRNRAGQKKSASDEIRELMGIPERFEVLNVIALGDKGEQKPPLSENDLKRNRLHSERFCLKE